jgi:hypothetical protein
MLEINHNNKYNTFWRLEDIDGLLVNVVDCTLSVILNAYGVLYG